MSTNLKKLWRPAIVAVLLIYLTSCGAKPARVITADRTVKPLPNGNYEVTPAWLLERYETERGLKRTLDELRSRR